VLLCIESTPEELRVLSDVVETQCSSCEVEERTTETPGDSARQFEQRSQFTFTAASFTTFARLFVPVPL
jgi:hypothetical protein